MSRRNGAIIKAKPSRAVAEAVVPEEGETRILLHDIRWETYEQLCKDLSDQGHVHLTYDGGELEIMAPSLNHEMFNRAIARLISDIALETETDLTDAGQTTLKIKKLERGSEPDTCFYIQHEAAVRGKKKIDLRRDPPPDVVFEVDITSGSVDKMPIYAGFGVPELWHYDTRRVQIYKLVGGKYVVREKSLAFPWLTGAQLTDFLETCKAQGQTAALRQFRQWLRATRRKRKT